MSADRKAGMKLSRDKNAAMVFDSVLMSVRSLVGNPVRAFLTVLGIMIGVAAVIALVALGNGAKSSVADSLQTLGSNLLIVYSGEPRGSSLVRRNTTNISPVLSQEDLDSIRQLSGGLISMAAPESSASVQLKVSNLNMAATAVGTDVYYPEVRNFIPVYGRFFDQEEYAGRSLVAVIGVEVYRQLFPSGDDPLGQKVRINGIGFEIIGIMQEKGNSSQDSSILIPMTAFQRSISGAADYAIINVQAANSAVMRDAQTWVETVLLQNHGIAAMDFADFYIANQLDILATAQGVTGTFTVLLAGIAAISLLVGGIGIMNIMLVSVTERTREIGVRMALGARPGDVLLQFLIESIILSIAGGIAGVLLGLLAAWLAVHVGNMAAVPDYFSVLLAFGFSLATGLFFGGYPAWRASRLDPIEALRYE